MTHATQDEEDAVGSLVKFELKKICSQRVTQVAVIVIAAFLAWVTTFNITSQFALDPNAVGVEFEGASAIAQQKENADALVGPITDKAATDAIREWKTFMVGDEIAERCQCEPRCEGVLGILRSTRKLPVAHRRPLDARLRDARIGCFSHQHEHGARSVRAGAPESGLGIGGWKRCLCLHGG